VEPASRPVRPSEPAPWTSPRAQLEGASLAARALLPVRFFFGATFIYAGLDKIVDPAFFDASSPASITAQLAAFARTSPLAFMIKPVEPYAILVGLLIALAEIAIGLGAVSGLLFRAAAAGGALLSLLFFLTASWATHPYYYGADLPYAFGWLALAIAGTSGLLVPKFIAEIGTSMEGVMPWGQRVASSAAASGFRPPRYLDEEPSASRRLVVQTGVLAAATFVVGSLGLPVMFLRRDDRAPSDGGTADTSGGAGPAAAVNGTTTGAAGSPIASTPPGGPTSAPHATPVPGFTASGLTVTTTAQVDQHGAVRIRVPVSAPASLPAGDPAMVVKLKNGGYACFDTVCTHQGCRVGWDAADGVLLCPCHGAAFDPNNHAAVLQGPTNQPLLELPITIDPKTGAITLKA
jgi:thiosulfate dehydrogenase [quinone] large subunit